MSRLSRMFNFNVNEPLIHHQQSIDKKNPVDENIELRAPKSPKVSNLNPSFKCNLRKKLLAT